MEQESRSGSSSSLLSGNGLVAVILLVAGAVFVAPTVLRDVRPATGEPRLSDPPGVQDVQARLWQDPLGAVERTRKAAGTKADAEATAGRVLSPLADPRHALDCTGPLQVLAVMLDGAPYSEPVESRRRTRYAVLSAMNASGFVPESSQHLGYFLVAQDAAAKPEAPSLALLPAGPAPGSAAASTFAIPFEWLRRPLPDTCTQALVLWIDGQLVDARPLGALVSLVNAITAPSPRPTTWSVLGPTDSGDLKRMLAELSIAGGVPSVSAAAKLRIYAHATTVPESVLTGQPDLDSDRVRQAAAVRDLFRDHGIDFARTIRDDPAITRALVEELSLRSLRSRRIVDPAANPCGRPERGQDSPDTVAVVADWDTLYGRNQRNGLEATPEHAGFCLLPFSYVRGLDGQASEGPTEANKPAGGDDKPRSFFDPRPTSKADASQIERAEGQPQLDYLRRLGRQIRARDDELRRHGDEHRIRAIGVLGNDLHDKLLVLQLLRREFPELLFFTTDLDARYLHPAEQAWTRNLIVASSFGLRLSDPLQADTPAFRDSYQASAYFATRRALAEAGAAAAPTGVDRPGCQDIAAQRPRIFEIGRNAAFDFSEAATGPCVVHADADAMYPSPPGDVRAGVALVVLVLLAGTAFAASPAFRYSFIAVPPGGNDPLSDEPPPATAGSRRRIDWNRGFRRAIRLGTPAVVVAVLAVAWGWNGIAEALTLHGKPMRLGEGLSTWPTQAGRAIALLACVYLIGRGWLGLSRNMDEIAREFRLIDRAALHDALDDLEAGMSPWQRALNNLRPRRLPATGPVAGLDEETLQLWKRYIARSRFWARLGRALVCVVLALLLVQALRVLIGIVDDAPVRGALSACIEAAMRLAASVLYFSLLFFVADATWLCVGFLRHLNSGGHAWPASAVEAFQQRCHLPPDLLHHWMNLNFIRLRTRCVCQLVYHPFVVLSLLLVARNPFFDNWSLSASQKVLIGLCILVALGCAMALRQTAEAARGAAIDRIDQRLLGARATGEAAAETGDARFDAEQARQLRQRIAGLKQGAFAPFTQQPLLRAALLPFAALGGPALLDALSLVNI